MRRGECQEVASTSIGKEALTWDRSFLQHELAWELAVQDKGGGQWAADCRFWAVKDHWQGKIWSPHHHLRHSWLHGNFPLTPINYTGRACTFYLSFSCSLWSNASKFALVVFLLLHFTSRMIGTRDTTKIGTWETGGHVGNWRNHILLAERIHALWPTEHCRRDACDHQDWVLLWTARGLEWDQWYW